MNNLSTLYRSFLPYFSHKEEMVRALETHLTAKKVEEKQIMTLLSKCEVSSVDHPSSFLQAIKEFISILFLAKWSGVCSPSFLSLGKRVFDRFLCHSFWDTFQIASSLLELSRILLEKPVKKESIIPFLPGAMLVESGQHLFDARVPQPELGIQLILVRLYLTLWGQEEKQVERLFRSASFFTRLCDDKGEPFTALWARESECLPTNVYACYYLLFSTFSHFTPKEKWKHFCTTLSDHLAKFSVEMWEHLDPFIIFLFLALQEEKKNFLQVKIEEEYSLPVDSKLGLLRYTYHTLHLVCTASGVNSGLGALHKGKTRILSFGPHFTPLADSKRYGLYRTCSDDASGFSDLLLEHQESKCRFQGWSRLVSPHRKAIFSHHMSSAYPGDQWLWFAICANKEEVTLETTCSYYKEENPLAFVFFLAAEKLLIPGEKPLLPALLTRFCGKNSAVRAVHGKEELCITPKWEGKMEVIPLAGGRYFFGANFLLVFPMEDKVPRYLWSIN